MLEDASLNKHRINEKVRRSGIHKDFKTISGMVLDVRERVSESGFERVDALRVRVFHMRSSMQSLGHAESWGLLSLFWVFARRHGLVLITLGHLGFGRSQAVFGQSLAMCPVVPQKSKACGQDGTDGSCVVSFLLSQVWRKVRSGGLLLFGSEPLPWVEQKANYTGTSVPSWPQALPLLWHHWTHCQGLSKIQLGFCQSPSVQVWSGQVHVFWQRLKKDWAVSRLCMTQGLHWTPSCEKLLLSTHPSFKSWLTHSFPDIQHHSRYGLEVPCGFQIFWLFHWFCVCSDSASSSIWIPPIKLKLIMEPPIPSSCRH